MLQNFNYYVIIIVKLISYHLLSCQQLFKTGSFVKIMIDDDDDRHFENGEVWWIWFNLFSMLLDASMGKW